MNSALTKMNEALGGIPTRLPPVYRQRSAIAVAALFGLSAVQALVAATFEATEGHIAQKAAVVLNQKPREISIKLDLEPGTEYPPELQPGDDTRWKLVRTFPDASAVYRIITDEDPPLNRWEGIQRAVANDPRFIYCYPAYHDAATGGSHWLKDEIIVKLKAPVSPQTFRGLSQLGVRVRQVLSQADALYVLKIDGPRVSNPFRIKDALENDDAVEWAEIDSWIEIMPHAIPNDTLWTSQWNLRNTGQNGAFTDADVDADAAWDGSQGYGSVGIRIAVLDNGFDAAHADLSGNMVSGYDFFSNDADPSPGTYDFHGTAVAGVAAAAANNSLGVAGIAGKCKILPVRVFEDDASHIGATTPSILYRALIYAADNADIISLSGETSVSGTITSGLSYAYTSGRNGKGCPIFCSSGNLASGGGSQSYDTTRDYDIYGAVGGAGNFFLGFRYKKDGSGSGGDDTVWLADITLPSGTRERLDSLTLPTGWQNYGDVSWTASVDAEHAHGTTGNAWRAGAIGNNQVSGIKTTLQAVDSTHRYVSLRRWISSAAGDNFQVELFNSSGTSLGVFSVQDSGVVQNRATGIPYPATNSYALAVGACSDFDYRSHYSQYGNVLKFVAPSTGGYGSVVTTDRTGSAGYASGDYHTGFGGTSASAPLAAGIAALVLSRDGNLTRSTVTDKLVQNCDKIGPVAYTGSPSRNDYYGYGRLNASASVSATTADTTAPTFSSATVMNYRAVDVTFSEPMGDGALTTGNYSITAGAGTLSANPSKVIRIKPSVYRLIWNSGDIATSGTVTIQASSSIKDVAGNALTTTSKNSTGTKRVIGINCGNRLGHEYALDYAAPFISDNGFQGNEAATFLTSASGIFSTSASISTTGVTDPAPEAVYQSHRNSWADGSSITYSIPNISGSNFKVRLHFCEFYFFSSNEQICDIYINSTLKTSWFDVYATAGGNQAVVLEYTGINPVNGAITVTITPRQNQWGSYNAAINGIEIVKP